MKKPRRSLILFLVWFIFVSHQILPVVCETGQYIAEEEEKSSFHHVVSRTLSSLKRTHQASLEKIKTIIHGVQMKFTPPPTPEAPGSGVSESVGDNMKEAAKPSVETSQATVAKPSVETSQATVPKPSVETSQATVPKTSVETSQATVPKTSVETSQATVAKPSVETSQATVAKTSVETSQAAVDGAAGGVHKTAEKIKESVPDNKESRNEL